MQGSEFSKTMKKCVRAIHAMHEGAVCPSEMFNQLDELVGSGQEERFVETIHGRTRLELRDIYANRKLFRSSYDDRYRTHLALCDAGYEPSD